MNNVQSEAKVEDNIYKTLPNWTYTHTWPSEVSSCSMFITDLYSFGYHGNVHMLGAIYSSHAPAWLLLLRETASVSLVQGCEIAF